MDPYGELREVEALTESVADETSESTFSESLCHDLKVGKPQIARVADQVFLKYLSKYGRILVSKSQTPSVKAKKQEATKLISRHLLIDKGIEYTPQQVSKKVQNLKAKLKAKTDVNRTGNRKINLSDGEKILADIMNAKDNPAINPIKCGIAIANKTIG
ncbi:uncharacterized protein LOC118752556 [Rhagoletis pomonella]|uniref:uncharacterized protein LOC118752556 n=1 Tax=Rhagoletis pomonella TaxID=28610 RepID=UPI00177BE444|nr:uncharacterized protein LOC118752556 [Rhagoletis pomonella]